MKKTGIVLFVLIFSLISVSCNRKQNDPQKEEVVVQPGIVQDYADEMKRSYNFISKPYRSTDLSFRVSGPVLYFNAQNGQFFRKGELIAAIDERDFRIRCERAKAVYERAKAEYARVSNLYERNNISATVYEQAKSDYAQAEAAYQTARNELADTRLVAPFDGYVNAIYMERYQDVKSSSPVISFIDLSKIKVEVYIPENILPLVDGDSDMKCAVTFNEIDDSMFTPQKIYVSQSTTDHNLSFRLTAIVDNHDNCLFGGMAGSLSLEFGSDSFSPSSLTSRTLRKSVLIPQTAVGHDDNNGSYVWKVNGQNRVQKIPVETGELLKNSMVEIKSNSLEVGDTVVVGGQNFLSENDKVKFQK